VRKPWLHAPLTPASRLLRGRMGGWGSFQQPLGSR
jgi:hypothetical protein